ncbi:MAG: hypothetical protein CM15mP18_2380 [Methanobacteriota archaeon]|nr:MAG: hypothetical protein CM15mP18_2380 [Euryarchaeota archaeon]
MRTECTATVVRAVQKVEEFDGRLRAAPVVDEAYVHGAVHRTEQLCFNGQVSVEHSPFTAACRRLTKASSAISKVPPQSSSSEGGPRPRLGCSN